ncbi:baseplate multidomain protein megatron [Ponticaulis profundi]|uniref:Glycoside hydrolase/phage tail family protein n=1 Tax=Ponticaulis profundi TaxID=2665222 RepID=A0ABW1S4S1_9PROT
MAQLVFAEVGARLGAQLLPEGLSVLGFEMAGRSIGSTLGGLAGRAVDQALAGPVAQGSRRDGLTLLESREGADMAQVFGRMRMGGQVIWATHLKERKSTHQTGGKGGPSVREYSYSVSFAVGLCEGEITGIDRIWANGELISLAGLNYRLYHGSETQWSDPLIEAVEGSAPAYRGLAYIVFEDFPLDAYGARLPQLSFEVVRPVQSSEGPALRDLIKSVNLIPASGEWVYSPELVRRIEYPGWEETLNRHSGSGKVDVVQALDQLQAELPHVSSVNLTLAWFGTDLRCGHCEVRPGVETRDQINLPRDWKAGGQTRESAHLISRDEAGRPYYGGTPDDASVIALMRELAARGLAVTVSPFLLMDIPPGNGLPDPYGEAEQAVFPWRGRITCFPALSGDKTSAARAQVESFFGRASASDFTLNGDAVTYTGPDAWSYRRFVLHLAMLAKASGVAARFLLGSELVRLTRVRDDTGAFPAVEELKALAGEVRAVLGSAAEISYAADWTEYGAYHPDDGTGDVRFPLDALWSDQNIDFVGIDWYAPLSDWRDGDHLDGALWSSIYDQNYLAANVAGGEGYDWYYASDADRLAQTRTPITDSAHGEDWMFRVKDLRGWWQNAHHERPGGTRQPVSTEWTPQSKPVRLIEIGCGAVDKGTNAPNVFHDPKSAESGFPPFSDGTRDDDIQAAALRALCQHWSVTSLENPVSAVYGGAMVPDDGLSVWAFDARPYPAFPVRSDVWSDGENWTLGHWLNGRTARSGLSDVLAELLAAADVPADLSAAIASLPGYAIYGIQTVREAIEPLVYAFDLRCRQSETGLVFANGGDQAAISIPEQDLVLADSRSSAQRFTRNVTEHAVRGLRLSVLDPSADYQPASVHIGVQEGDRDTHIQLPFALDADSAARLAGHLMVRLQTGAHTREIDLSPQYQAVEVGDLLLLDGEAAPLRIAALERGHHLRAALEPVRDVFGGSSEVSTGNPPPAHAPRPDGVLINLPSLPGGEDDVRPVIAAFARPWPGALSVAAGADATMRTTRAEIVKSAKMGSLLDDFPAGPGDRFRPGARLLVRFPQGDLSSVTGASMLAGANHFAIETSGGWMVGAFKTAELCTSDTWELSGLLTGLYGTEDLSALGAETGARIVMLDASPVRAELADHEVGQVLNWHVAGQTAEAEPLVFEATASGRARSPLRPGHLRATEGVSGDLTLSWTRRARHSADRWDTPDVPLLEDELRFRVEILSGETLVRSEEVSESMWVYSVAMQAADGFSPAVHRARVCQLSPVFGDGIPALSTFSAA